MATPLNRRRLKVAPWLAVLAIGSVNSILAQQPTEPTVSAWIERLQNGDRAVRMAIAFGPFRTGAPENDLPPLLKAAEHSDPEVRRYAVSALSELGAKPDVVIPALMRAIRDKDESVRQYAVVALARVGRPAIPALIDLLTGPRVVLSWGDGADGRTHPRTLLSDLAMIALAKIDEPVTPDLVEAYRKTLRSEQPRRQRSALRRSERRPTAGDETSSHDFARMIELIGSARREEVDNLVRCLSDDNLKVRRVALGALTSIRPQGAAEIEAISVIARSASGDLGLKAIEALEKIGPRALPHLGAIVERNPAPIKQVTAVRAMKEILPAATPYLVRFLRTAKSASIRSESAQALDELAGDVRLSVPGRANFSDQATAETGADYAAAVAALAQTLKDQDPSVRQNAASTLRRLYANKRIPSQTGIGILPELIEALKKPDGQVQADVACTLGFLGANARGAVPFLVDGLRTPPGFRIGAVSESWRAPEICFASAIGAIGIPVPGAVDVLRNILQDPSRKQLHPEAVVALGKLGAASESAVPLLAARLRVARDYNEQSETARALAKIQPAGVSALLQIIENSAEPESVRIVACGACSDLINRDPGVLAAFRRALTDSRLEIRLSVARYLMTSPDDADRALQLLAEAEVAGQNPPDLLGALVKSGSRAVPTIVRLSAVGGLRVKNVLIYALAGIYEDSPGDPRIVPALVRFLQDSNPQVREQSARALAKVRPADATVASTALLELLRREIVPAAEYRARVERQGPARSFPSKPAKAAFESLTTLGPAASGALPALVSWLKYPDAVVRSAAVLVLKGLGASALSARSELLTCLQDGDLSVRAAAIQALTALGLPLSDLGPAFTTAAVDDYLNQFFLKSYASIFTELRASTPVNVSHFPTPPQLLKPGSVPQFPWPNPPRPAHVGVFGRELSRALLGSDATRLGDVYQRLYDSLVATDQSFESGLFGVPGGFALVAKIERIKGDGFPLPGQYRWARGYVPPQSISEYVGQLLFEKPGYFRVLVFVITSQSYEGQNPSGERLPETSEGAQELPDVIAREALGGKHAYLLVYSFERERGGYTKDFTLSGLSALVHFQRSGVMQRLSTR
ncbi:MAG TPA: HEAT repeat domain-containing protein [Blastocatellia bacterium]|nr:HEAT repeat domain-containing protein [Blastocatellia bacterium]